MRLALDTNILAYAEGVNTAEMKRSAVTVLDRLPQSSVVLPVQVLGELFQVLVRKAHRSPAKAREAVLSWRDSFQLVETSATVMIAAADVAVTHQLGIWDAVILCSASEAKCRLLLSEDMQSGFTWGGVTIVNPFAPPLNPFLTALLAPEQ